MEYLKMGIPIELSERQKTVIEIYTKFHKANKHKMLPIPVCEIPTNLS
jgi:NAD+ synthase